MIDFRAVTFLLGVLLSLLAVFMLIPLGVEFLIYETGHWKSFATSSFLCGFTGALLATSNQPSEQIELSVREAFLLTTLLWVMSCFVAAFPFYFSEYRIDFINALFESTSALTTTGATILTGLDNMPKAILLWRALLQWIGGIGIIVTAMIIFPALRIGGMQLFRSEFSDKSEKILPRVSQIASSIVGIYVVLTLACASALHLAGMGVFDSICHAMSTLSTGGLSTKDASIAAFDSRMIEYVIAFFMILGGGPLVLYIHMWQKNMMFFFKDPQFRTYLLFMFFMAMIICIWCIFNLYTPLSQTISHGIFTVVSVVTTTGFVVSDYTIWGQFAATIFLGLSLVGGCTGSTSGGVKIFRFQVIFRSILTHLKQLRRQYGVYIPLYQGHKLEAPLISSVYIFVFLYVMTIVFLAILISLFEVDFLTAFSGSVAAVGNIGAGLGKIIGPSGSFGPLDMAPKLLFMFGMILGRLELLTVIVLFLPSFWRD